MNIAAAVGGNPSEADFFDEQGTSKGVPAKGHECSFRYLQ